MKASTKTNGLIIGLVVAILGGIVGLILWIKKNASTILAETASKTVEDMNEKDLSLKDILRNTTGIVLEKQTDSVAESMAEATKGFFNRVLKR